ncbi:nuclease-like protein [Scopulibacillus darangshiensis]|uniref:Nuclease-like protein n=1 Tax=Scopulibacillus darangshiensis TaxID=442528 RepID=A0A4R2NN02_9BACL|nr:nuclease-related domain-containing protein [Scopulibacillus darangshiensis]TCP22685.1 nuclease-like protein [Scopulibacillus darangshiensis]
MWYGIAGLAAALVVCIWYIFYQKRKMTKRHSNLVEKMTAEEAATKASMMDEQNEKERLHKEEVEQLTNTYHYEINKLQMNINELQAYSKNKGEIITHQILGEMKSSIVAKEILGSSDLHILPNVFIPYKEKGLIKTRQIDHLVILPTGIYVIETKYWRGKVVHGLNRKNAGDLSFITDMMASEHDDFATDQTLIFVPFKDDESEQSSIRIKSYGDPAKQVKHTSYRLKQFLSEECHIDTYVTPIVYFGYPKESRNGALQGVIDLSDDKQVKRFVNEKGLTDFFANECSKKAVFSTEDIGAIKETLEGIEYSRI